MAFMLAQGHQRARTTAGRANGDAGLLQRAIARVTELKRPNQGHMQIAHLEGKRWRHEATTEAQRLDGATTVGLRLRKDCFGERGLDATEREKAHRRVSRAADSMAELTEA
jgi:hypothetical protein